MPELPEAEYMVRRLRECAPAARITRVRILRESAAEGALARHARGLITGYGRRAKNVLIHLDTGYTIRIQLGMTGHVYWTPNHRRLPRFTRIAFIVETGAALVFEDARVFGAATAHPTARLPEILADYGPEPLDPTFRWSDLQSAAHGLRQPVKPFLMDQRRVAGLGNIWAAEALFAARIHPARPVSTLDDQDWRALHRSIRATLRRAIANTFKVTSSPDEFPEADLLTASVYGRAGLPCRRCRTPIVREIQAARATYYCPRCQPVAALPATPLT
jgi:formamidopyrimidine-DNA glycosylase